jgi:hypothetical protein
MDDLVNVAVEAKKANAAWTLADETTLINFLWDNKAVAGDGMAFKSPTWTAAAALLMKTRTKGGAKNAASCKNKWRSPGLHAHHPLLFYQLSHPSDSYSDGRRCLSDRRDGST